MPADPAQRVGIRCDARAAIGVGHLVRCIALAEELVGRGHEVVFFGVVDVPWASRQLADRGLAVVPAAHEPHEFAQQVEDASIRRLVVDGYHLPEATGQALRERGVAVLAVLDGAFGAEQAADLYLDQNLGARPGLGAEPAAQTLSGLDYVLLRDVVRRRRPDPEAQPPDREVPKVLAVFGGTDPHGAAEVVSPLLAAASPAFELTVVAARPSVAEALHDLDLTPGQAVTVVPPVDDLPSLAVEADLVLSAAGTSTWELLCLGAPTALVCVTDNQEMGYTPVVDQGLAAPLGRLEDLRATEPAREAAVASMRHLLADRPTRLALRERGMRRVDGRGRERVADALLALGDPP